MSSVLWILAAVIGGGCLGMLIMALMSMSGGLPERSMVSGDLGVHPDMMGPV